MRDCIKRVMEVSGLDKDKAKEMLDSLKKEAERHVELNKGLVDFDEAIKKIAGDFAYNNKLKSVQSLRAKVKNSAVWSSYAQQVIDSGGDDNARIAYHYSSLKTINNAKSSSAVMSDRLLAASRSKALSLLQRDGVLAYAKNKNNDVNIVKEWSILEGGNETPTGDANAVKAAKVLSSIHEEQRVSLNKEGAYIEKRRGFSGTQYHNKAYIKKVPVAEYVKDVSKLIDTKKMDLLDGEIDLVLSKIRDDIVEDRYNQGELNVAANTSKSRVLIFKDAASFVEYNNKYGMKGILENALIKIEQNARNIAMMKRYGVKPREMFEKMKAEVKNENTRIVLENTYLEMSGATLEASNKPLATIFSSLRAFNLVTLLRSPIFSSPSDLVKVAVKLQQNGVPIHESWMKAIAAPIRMKYDNKQIREIGEFIGIATKVLNGRVIGGSAGFDNIGGSITKGMNVFFKLNLFNRWTDALQSATMSGILNSHARHSVKEFDKLPTSAREVFNAYGIKKEDWGFIQKAVTEIEGYSLIDPEKISDTKVREKYENLLFDQSSIATSEQSVRVRAMTNQGKPRGYLVNELWKLAFQLKPFAMTSLRDQWEIAERGVGKFRRGDYRGAANEMSFIMQLAIGGTALAAVGNALSDMSKGQEPTFDWDRAIAGSAFGGLVSDLTVNYALNTYGQQYLARIMGPTFGRTNEVVSYASGATYREPPWRSYIPGQNLYFAPALEYLFINEAIDTFAPGYLNDVERKMNKQGEPLVGPSLYRDMQ